MGSPSLIKNFVKQWPAESGGIETKANMAQETPEQQSFPTEEEDIRKDTIIFWAQIVFFILWWQGDEPRE